LSLVSCLKFGDNSIDPIEEWLTIDPNDVTGKLIPNPKVGNGEKSRVQDSIDIFGLNLDPHVRKQRSEAYEAAVRAAFQERWEDLRLSSMRHRPHSIAARIVLTNVAPRHLPSLEDETRDLVNSLWAELRTLIYEIRDLQIRGRLIRNIDKRQLRVLVWALVVLLNDPPAGDSGIADALAELLEVEEPHIRKGIASMFQECRLSPASSLVPARKDLFFIVASHFSTLK